MKLHHATAKKAARLGLEIVAGSEGFSAIRLEDDATSAEIFATTSELFAAFESDEMEFETEAGDDEGEFGQHLKSGVMVLTYHRRYTANGGGCGDTLDATLRDLLVNKGKTDLDLLREIAESNGVWSESWAALNPGMQRMNMANRMRAILRNSSEATLDLGAEGVGRFGVEYNPSKKVLRANEKARAALAV